MCPTVLLRVLVLCVGFLGILFSSPDGAAEEGHPDGLELLAEGHAAIARGDTGAALDRFAAAARWLTGTPHRAERVAALAALGRVRVDVGDLRGALLAWTEALPLADGLIATEDPRADLSIFLRLQLVELLRESDPGGSERLAWEAVQVGVRTGEMGVAAAPVAAVFAAAEDDGGLRNRLVELDELLAPLDAYRLHSLPRPLPLSWLVHDLGRQYAEAGAFGEAERHFTIAARGWLAMDAPDLAATALVDIGRARMEQLDYEGSARALMYAPWLIEPPSAGPAGRLEILADLLDRAGDRVAAGAVWEGLVSAEPGGSLRHATLRAHEARFLWPQGRVARHRQVAVEFAELGNPSLAVGQYVAAATELARLPFDQALSIVLDKAAVLLAEEGVVMPQLTEAARQIAIAELAARRGQGDAARLALGEAGTIQFRVGATEAVAWTASRYVDVALAAGSMDDAEAALTNARQLERDLGLELDGWAALAAEARLALAGEDAERAERAWAEAATRIERLARFRQLEDVEGVPRPQDVVHRPWIAHLLAAERRSEALVVALRAAPVPSRTLAPLQAREAMVQLRAELVTVSTTAGETTPEEARAPLVAAQRALYDTLPPEPQCDASGIQALLGDGDVAFIESPFHGEAAFVVHREGVETQTRDKRRKEAGTRVLRRAKRVLRSPDSSWTQGRYRPVELGADWCNASWLAREVTLGDDMVERAAAAVWGPLRAR